MPSFRPVERVPDEIASAVERNLTIAKATLKAIVEDDEFFDLTAQANMKAYDALRLAGFNSDQAVQIIAGQGGLKSG